MENSSIIFSTQAWEHFHDSKKLRTTEQASILQYLFKTHRLIRLHCTMLSVCFQLNCCGLKGRMGETYPDLCPPAENLDMFIIKVQPRPKLSNKCFISVVTVQFVLWVPMYCYGNICLQEFAQSLALCYFYLYTSCCWACCKARKLNYSYLLQSCPDAIDEVFNSKLHIVGGIGITIGVIMVSVQLAYCTLTHILVSCFRGVSNSRLGNHYAKALTNNKKCLF